MSEAKEPGFKPIAPTVQHTVSTAHNATPSSLESHPDTVSPSSIPGVFPAQAQQSSTMAVIALVLGIISTPIFIFAVPALIVSIIAMKQTANNKQAGRGMAIAGLVLSIIAMLFLVLWVVVVIIGLVSSSRNVSSNYNNYDYSTESSYSQKETLSGAKGATIQADKYDIIVTNVQRGFTSTDPGDSYLKPTAGKEYVIVTLKLKNKQSYASYYSSYNFQIKDSAGKEHLYVYMTGIKQFSYKSTATNSEAEGQVVFEVPISDTSLTLVYTPSGIASQKTEVKL